MDPVFIKDGHMHDEVFRRIFTTPDNLDLATELIATYLELPESATEGLVLCNGELPPEHYGEKSCRLDLLASMEDRMVNLELQYGHSEDFFMRNLFTLSRIIGIHTKRSDSYGSIPKINLINLIDFSFERIKREVEAFLGILRGTGVTYNIFRKL